MSIGTNIKQLRLNHNLTQEELANKLGVSDKAVSTWENDIKIPRMGSIEKMAIIFDVCKSDIIEDNNSNYVSLTPHEKNLINAYRNQRNMQSAIDKLLGLDNKESNKLIPTLVAARSKNNDEPIHIENLPDLSKIPADDTEL